MGLPKLATGDYLFLAFLKNGPCSSYDIKREMNSSVSFFWSAQHSQVYQQATRLRRDGFIEPKGSTSVRNRQLLVLTEKGTEAVDRWLREPASTYRVYDESLAKVYFASLTDRSATEELLRDQQERHADLLAEFEGVEKILGAVDFADIVPGQLYALQLGMEVERAYLRWIRHTLVDLHRSDSED